MQHTWLGKAPTLIIGERLHAGGEQEGSNCCTFAVWKPADGLRLKSKEREEE